MRIRVANQQDAIKIRNAVRRKNLPYCTPCQIADDARTEFGRFKSVWEKNNEKD